MKKMDQPHVDGIRRGEKTLNLKWFGICRKAMEFGWKYVWPNCRLQQIRNKMTTW
jgi:hypothetical protein